MTDDHDNNQSMYQNQQTLIKYDNPVLVSHPDKSSTKTSVKPISSLEITGRPSTEGILDSKKEIEEILNAIIPPRCWEEHNQLWRQNVSISPSTRQDVINLQEMLDTRLQQTQARETGICPVRRELFTECFDELIRQVTINCTERGLLLLRIRDEIAMSMEAYDTLYSSSVTFGLRKALQAEGGKEKLLERVLLLEEERLKVENAIGDMKIKSQLNERRNAELKACEEKRHAEEVAFLKNTNAQLNAQLEGITAPKK